MGELLALILPLALGAAVSPLTLLAMLAVLSGPRPIARGAALTAGVITLTGLLLGVGFVLITATDYGEPGTRGPLGSPVASTTVGGALITYAAYLFFHRPADAGDPGPIARRLDDPRTSLMGFYGAGVGLTLVNISSLVLLLAIINNVAESRVSLGTALIVLTIAGLIATLAASGPLLVALLGVSPAAQ